MKSKIQNSNSSFLKWVATALLVLPMILLIINKGKPVFIIDAVNLLIHEGGHGIFKLFGNRFLHTLGGTIMQILIPSLFVGYYVYVKNKFPAQISLIWLGHNFMNVGLYAADAQERALPLLGGNRAYHDWHYLLRELQLIKYDDLIGQIFFWLGVVSFIFVILIPFLIKEYQSVSMDLKL